MSRNASTSHWAEDRIKSKGIVTSLEVWNKLGLNIILKQNKLGAVEYQGYIGASAQILSIILQIKHSLYLRGYEAIR